MNKISKRLCLLALSVVCLLSIQMITQQIAEGQTAKRKTSKLAAKPKPRKRTIIEVASIPTPIETVDEMLRLANIKKGDVLYDLGSGDGRIPLEAARKYGIRAIGVEIKPKLVEEANQRAKAEGINNLAKFLQADLFRMSYRDATIVTLYLSDELNLRLLPTLLRDLRPGARIISHDFRMGDWKPDISTKVPWKNLYRNVHVWIVPKDKNIEHLMRNSVNTDSKPDRPLLELDKTKAVLACPTSFGVISPSCDDQTTIQITLKDLSDTVDLKYEYEVSGGKIVGDGKNVNWDLTGMKPGYYKIKGVVASPNGNRETLQQEVSVVECPCHPVCKCPTFSINPSAKIVRENEMITFTAIVNGGSQDKVNYQWKVSNGRIISGQGTSSIRVDNKGLAGKEVEAILELDGMCAECPRTAVESVKVTPR